MDILDDMGVSKLSAKVFYTVSELMPECKKPQICHFTEQDPTQIKHSNQNI